MQTVSDGQMLGFGALGELALGEVSTVRLTANILRDVVTEFVDKERLPSAPAELHHFTSLEVACHIIKDDDVRLSHAEYSNDQTEMEEAKQIIQSELQARGASNPFFTQILNDFQRLAP